MVWAYFPETKGLSLEEIAVLFGDEVVSEPQVDDTIHGGVASDEEIGKHSKPSSVQHVEQSRA